MRILRYTILTAIFMYPVFLPAQNFIVMSLKGKVEARTEGKKKSEWRKLNIGDQLTANDAVRTAFASYAKLMMDQSRLVSVDENSTVKLSMYRQNEGSTATTTSGKLLQYAAAQMRKSHGGEDENIFGAVRGEIDIVSAVYPKQRVMTTMPEFRWVDPVDGGQYELLLLDDSFAVIERLHSNEHLIQYKAGRSKPLDHDHEYHWRVRRLSDGLESGVESFRILSADSIAAIQHELEQLNTELKNMHADDVTLHLIRGVYFEQKGLFTDAFNEYCNVVRLSPDVEEYRDIFRKLLFQMRLYNEEDLLLPTDKGNM